MQEREFAQSGAVRVHIAIETRGPQFSQGLLDALTNAKYTYFMDEDAATTGRMPAPPAPRRSTEASSQASHL